jgi:hypothetical protein
VSMSKEERRDWLQQQINETVDALTEIVRQEQYFTNLLQCFQESLELLYEPDQSPDINGDVE